MPFVPANAREFAARVIETKTLSRRYFMLRLERPVDLPVPVAGSFVHMEVPAADRFYMRRPFSIHDCDDDVLELLIVELGPGTQVLRRASAGDTINFYGPLGSGFPLLPGKRILAIGGGVGLAPLYFYGFRSPADACGESYRLLYGARSAEDLFLDHVGALRGPAVRLATDDGSHGFEGNVVELARAELKNFPADVIFSCGPTVMMKSVQELAVAHGLDHYASLENRMGCALGACRACVVPTRLDGGSPYRTVCHDGPVFDAADLLWDRLPTP